MLRCMNIRMHLYKKWCVFSNLAVEEYSLRRLLPGEQGRYDDKKLTLLIDGQRGDDTHEVTDASAAKRFSNWRAESMVTC